MYELEALEQIIDGLEAHIAEHGDDDPRLRRLLTIAYGATEPLCRGDEVIEFAE